jgi:hypothetical protein
MEAFLKTSVKSVFTKIQVVGSFFRLGIGIAKLVSGDFVGATGEVVSRALSFITGAGTAVSIVVEGLETRDLCRDDY